jgi:hypothetical protein
VCQARTSSVLSPSQLYKNRRTFFPAFSIVSIWSISCFVSRKKAGGEAMREAILAGILILFANTLSGCGRDESEDWDQTDPEYIDGVSRARFCLTRATPEDSAVAAELIAQIKGTWVNYPNESGGYERREFLFDADRSRIAVTEYHGWWKDIDDINYRKLCVSKSLDASAGGFSGFSVVEVMASNNEGGAVILVKRESPTRLLVSSYYYKRWAASKLMRVDELLSLNEIKKVWVYPEKQ